MNPTEKAILTSIAESLKSSSNGIHATCVYTAVEWKEYALRMKYVIDVSQGILLSMTKVDN
jgi:hypothetical protein